MAYIGTSPSQGVRHRYLFTATSGQTTFSGADDDSRTLSYTDTKFMDVFLNGVLLDPNSDYTATTGTSVVLTSGASAGDLLEVIAFDSFSVFSGTFGGDVTVGGDLSTSSINGGQVGGRRNMIINGDMRIAQRGTSGSVSSSFTFVLDRWSQRYNATDELAATVTQDTDAPDGFSNSYKWTTTTAETTLASDEYVYVNYKMEAQDAQHLAYGSASAKSVTLSFWVKSSVTGTYAVGIYATDGPRIINKTYTINSANTWEKKSITIEGDTGGTIDNDNAEGLRAIFHLAVGSDSKTVDSSSWVDYVAGAWGYGHNQDGVVTTTSATWQITGVQLEVGSVATEFEHRSYGEELALCQRYYVAGDIGNDGGYGYKYSGNTNTAMFNSSGKFPVEMRIAPTISVSGVTYVNASALLTNVISTKVFLTRVSVSAGLSYRATGQWEADAEL
jgi:hypothetical protein